MKHLITIFLLIAMLSSHAQIGTTINDFTVDGTLNQTTLDNGSVFNFNQVTAGRTITIPAPTSTVTPKNLKLRNIGTATFTLVPGDVSMPPRVVVGSVTYYSMILMEWVGSAYSVTAVSYTKSQADGKYLQTEIDPKWTLDKPSYATSASVISGLATKEPTVTAGTVGQYYRGDKTWQAFPSYASEVDPVWSGVAANYYTKSQGDARYLQSYTELDPVWTAAIASYYTKTQADARYLQSFTELDPVWTTASANYFTKTLSDARYLQSFTETDPQFDTKFSVKSTTNLTEGSNLYYTSARFNTAFAGKSTSDLIEGSNLYYTAARFNTSFTGKSTTDLAEGTNQYFTTARARAAFTPGTGISIPSGVITNTAPDQVVVFTEGPGISITGTYPNFTIGIKPTTYSFTNRSLNSNFTPSASKECDVVYTVTCSVTNPLLVGTSSATVFLEWSTNSGTTWNNGGSNGNSSGVGITVTVQLTNGQTGILWARIPVNALVRLRSVIAGTASASVVSTVEMVR